MVTIDIDEKFCTHTYILQSTIMTNCHCYDSNNKNYICSFCIDNQADSRLWDRHTSKECNGCYYCTEEELVKRNYHGFMYERFVEQYGSKSVNNFMLVKNELLVYFQNKHYKQLMAELVFRWQSCR
jgi:hypothetical protein